MQTYLVVLVATLRVRLAELRARPESGYTTETVLMTAGLVIIALAVIAIVVAKVTGKANSINLG